MYDDILDRHKHVLDGTDESAGRFTQRVAWDLRATHVLIRKTGGTRCDGPGGGIDCDKVMERAAPHAIYDIVVSAGGPQNRPGWSHARNHDGTLAYGRPSMAVEPEPYDTTPGPSPTPTPVPVPAPDCRYQPVDLQPVLDALAALRRELAEVRQIAEAARDKAPPVIDVVTPAPVYRGTLSLPGWLGGGRPITLTPVVED